MLGKFLSKTIKVVTLPIDAASSALDIVVGGDGSKHSRNDPDFPNPFSLVEQVRDAVAKAAEDLDKD